MGSSALQMAAGQPVLSGASINHCAPYICRPLINTSPYKADGDTSNVCACVGQAFWRADHFLRSVARHKGLVLGGWQPRRAMDHWQAPRDRAGHTEVTRFHLSVSAPSGAHKSAETRHNAAAECVSDKGSFGDLLLDGRRGRQAGGLTGAQRRNKMSLGARRKLKCRGPPSLPAGCRVAFR